MQEKWLPVRELYRFDSNYHIVEGYKFPDGKYYVSDKGRFMKNGKIRTVKADAVGTYTFSLGKHRFKLHQIVLQTFRPEGIKDGYSPDHINRFDRLNNSLDNLRWADKNTQVYNRTNLGKSREVYCYETNKTYSSCKDAELEIGLPHNMVCRVARGDRKSVHGYHFEYADEFYRKAKEQMCNLNYAIERDQIEGQTSIFDLIGE